MSYTTKLSKKASTTTFINLVVTPHYSVLCLYLFWSNELVQHTLLFKKEQNGTRLKMKLGRGIHKWQIIEGVEVINWWDADID